MYGSFTEHEMREVYDDLVARGYLKPQEALHGG